MEKIKYINKDFDFNGLSLAHPNGLQGGSYFTKLSVNNESMYLQTKRCKTKQGIVKTVKKTYCDLMFDKNDSDVVDWFENLEERLIELIYDKRKLWFHNELDKDDISSSFSSPIRTYKSGKYYLVRVHLSHANILSSGEFNCYDEQGQSVDPNTLNDQELKVIPLIEIQGVKFSSRNFSVEISLKQMMVLNKEEETFNKCLITIPTKNVVKDNKDSLDSSENKEEVIQEDPKDINIDTKDENIIEKSPSDLGKIELTELTSNDSSSIHSSEDNSIIESSTVNENENENVVEVTGSIVEDSKTSSEKNLVDNGNNGNNENNSNNEITLEIEDLEQNDKNQNNLEEFEVSLETLDVKDNDTVKLREPNEVYMEIWREARKRAKQARKTAIEAYLEAKNIKSTYMINEIDDSDSEDEFDNIINSMEPEQLESKSIISLGQN